MIGAARSAAASIVGAGGRNGDTLTVAAEFVTRFTAVEFCKDQILDDVLDPRLHIRLRGDLILVAENLTMDAAVAFTHGMTALARSCPEPERALVVVDDCKVLLGIRSRR
jgi:hypothetical protein